MRNKLFAFILVLVMAVSTLYGCGLIRKNNERDMDQVIVEVGDSEYKDTILKRDLVNLFISQGSSYMQNYQMTASQVMEVLLEQLINNRLIVQQGAKALIEQSNLEGGLSDYFVKNEKGKIVSTGLITLLGGTESDDYKIAIGNVYKYEKETLDYYEEEYNKEQATPEPSDTPEPTPTPTATPTPRPTKQPEATPTETPYPANPSPSTESRIEAKRRLEAALEDQELTYEEFFDQSLVSQLENQIVEKYSKHLQKTITIDLDSLKARYDFIEEQDRTYFKLDLNAYETKLSSAGSDTFIIYNPVDGYGYVKNLLVSFNDEQAAELAELQYKQWSTTQYRAQRSLLLEALLLAPLNDLRENIEDADKVNYTSLQTFFNDRIINHQVGGNNLYPATLENGIYKNTTLSQEAKNDFIDLIFQYGSDPGMFNNEVDYLSTPKQSASATDKYVTEFAKAARDVILAGEGSYTIVGTDYGWHILLCTQVLQLGVSETIDEAIFTQIDTVIKNSVTGDEFDEMSITVRESFTYKLYKVMREEIKTSVLNNAVQEIIEGNSDQIVKYESRYADLMAIA